MTARLWLRAHLYKVMVLVVLALLLLQYAFSSIFEARQLEPLFAINSSVARGLRRLHGRPRDADPAAAAAPDNATAAPEVFRNNTFAATEQPDNTTQVTPGTATPVLPLCPPIPPNLEGPVEVVKDSLPLTEVNALFPMLEPGGQHRPEDCRARYKVAVIVPYRDRVLHLSIFLRNIHPLMQRQQLDYRIFVVEQDGNGAFNRAMLMNVGFVEALKLYDFDCFIFHDVDLMPEDDRNLYTCPEQPRHMSVAIDVFKYRLPYPDIFGGVSAMTREQFQKVNGFSNMFWGWGGEDDDMSNRIRFHGYHISRYPANVARYKMLSHRKQHANPKRYEFLNSGRKRFKSDGINSLHYQRKDLKLFRAFTQIMVELATPS